VIAAEIQSAPILYYHETSDEPQLTQLLNEFDYSEYISDGATEFEQMALLKDWVYNHIPYELNYNDSELRNSISILQRATQGDSFLCTNMAVVFMQSSLSLGWTSRYILLKKPTKEEHAGNDIWSNFYKKWIYIDATWNIHVEKNKVPLSIREMRREWLSNKGAHVEFVFGAGSSEKRFRLNDLPVVRDDSKIWKYIPLDRTWLSYASEISVLGRNDFFSCCSRGGSNAYEPVYVLREKASFKDKIIAFFNNGKSYKPRMLFYDLNRVDIKIVQPRGNRKGFYPGKAEVRLNAFGKNNYTPNFMEFLVKINNADWKVMDENFQIKLIPGANSIHARIMNRFGVVGPISVKYIKVKKSKE
jgi:hypothetical protein